MTTDTQGAWGIEKPRHEMTVPELWEKYRELPGEQDVDQFSMTYIPVDFYDVVDREHTYAMNPETVNLDDVKPIYFQMVAHIELYAPQTAVVIRSLWYNHSVYGQRIVFVWQALLEVQQQLGLPAQRPPESAEELEKKGKALAREQEKQDKAQAAEVQKAIRKAGWDERIDKFGRRRAAIAQAELTMQDAKGQMKKAMAEAEANLQTFKQSWKQYVAGLKAEVERVKALPMNNWEEE